MEIEDSNKSDFRSFLKQKRIEAGLTMEEMHELSVKFSEQGKCLPFSTAYYCQVEKGSKVFERINFDLIWATGVILGFDPVNFYIQTRKKIDNKYLKENVRSLLFKNPVDNNKVIPDAYVVILSNDPKQYLDFRGMPVAEIRRAKHYKSSKIGQTYVKKALDRVKSSDWPGAYIEEISQFSETS